MSDTAHPEASTELDVLVESLLSKTRQGKIRWSRTGFPGGFAFLGVRGSVLLLPTREAGVVLKILDEAGDDADSYESPARGEAVQELYDAVCEQWTQNPSIVRSIVQEVQSA